MGNNKTKSGLWLRITAAMMVAVVAAASAFTLAGCGGNQESKAAESSAVSSTADSKTETTAATTAGTTTAATTKAATTAATKAPATTAPAKTVDQVIKEGYEKIGTVKLYKNINNYRNKKILTAVLNQDVGSSAIYSAIINDKNDIIAFYRFNFKDANEIKKAAKGDYAAIYGTVGKEGIEFGTIEVYDCHVVALGKEAKTIFDSLKDDKISTITPTTAPATKPTTAPATTKPTTKPTQAPTQATKATTATQPTSPSKKVRIYENNNIAIDYEGMDSTDDYFISFAITVKNNIGYDFFIGATDSKVNGDDIDLIGIDRIANGKTVEAELYLLKSDLEDMEITSVDELKFKFEFRKTDDDENPIVTEEITIKPFY